MQYGHSTVVITGKLNRMGIELHLISSVNDARVVQVNYHHARESIIEAFGVVIVARIRQVLNPPFFFLGGGKQLSGCASHWQILESLEQFMYRFLFLF